MRIVRRYLLRTIVSMTALVLIVLLGLGFFIQFVGQLDDVNVGDYGVANALVFAAMKLPGTAFDLLPMATLLGTLLGMGSLASNNEMTALRAAGVSVMSLARSLAGAGAIIAVITLVIGNFVAPPLEKYGRQYRALLQHGEDQMSAGASAWIREGNTFLNISQMGDDPLSGGVFMFRISDGERLTGIGRADSAGVNADNQWVLKNYAETNISDTGVTIRSLPTMTQATRLHPDLLELTVMRPDQLSGPVLYRYVQFLDKNGLDSMRYSVAFWTRMASSLAAIPMCVLALPFVFGPLRSAGAGGRMIVGILIGLGYFLAARSLADGGQVYGLDPLLVAWLPTIVVSLFAIGAVARTR